MKHILSAVALFATLQASAQQVNPVPDYVFRNQMSVGRNAVTDTAAYFSIGPRYGATKGLMPPIVGDTATFSSGKRNGLLIFSVQKNKFLYWDSVRVQWSDMAGSSGSYIVAGDTSAMLAPYLRKVDTTSMLTAYLRKGDTASMLSPYYRSATASATLALKLNISDTSSMLGNYVRHAGYGLTKSGQSFLVDTAAMATRARVQKGIDSIGGLLSGGTIGGSGTTNYLPKFTASTTLGNSLIYDNGSTIGIGSTAGTYYLEAKRNGTADIVANSSADNNSAILSVYNSGAASLNFAQLRAYGNTTGSTLFGSSTNKMVSLFSNGDALLTIGTISSTPLDFGTANSNRMRIFANGRIGVNTTTDAGYQFDVNGTLRTVNGANFATTSGNVGIGTTSPGVKLDIGSTADQTLGVKSSLSNYLYAGTYQNYAIFAVNRNPSNGTFADATKATADIALGGLANEGLIIFNTTSTNNSTATERMRLTASGELLINTTTDAGDYKLQVAGNIYNTGSAVFAATSGNVGIGTASPVGDGTALNIYGSSFATIKLQNSTSGASATDGTDILVASSDLLVKNRESGSIITYTANTERGRINSAGEWIIDASGTDAGDYKLQVSGNIYNTGSAVLAATGGDVLIRGTNNPLTATNRGNITLNGTASNIVAFTNGSTATGYLFQSTADMQLFNNTATGNLSFYTNAILAARFTPSQEFLINTETDAGDYKLQVVGNARVGTGKLDIASNTTFGLGVARSGTSEIAGQIYNSNGILYLGAESSAGGQIFTGSSAYAAVIGSGANYPLQFATNNITRATMTTSGNLLLGFTTDSYFLKLQVNGSIFSNNQVIIQNAAAQLSVDSSANVSPIYLSNQSLTGSSAQGMIYGNGTWNTTGAPSLIDLNVTNTASGADANYIKITDGSNIFRVTKDAGIITGIPSGGSAKKWKLGAAATVSPTSPNRTIQIEVDGTVYYLHAKTTND